MGIRSISVTKEFLSADGLTAFCWYRHKRPPEWVDAAASVDGPFKRERRFLVGEVPWPDEDFRPFKDHHGLWRTFVDLDGSESGFEAFARKYGMLGLPCEIAIPYEVGHFSLQDIRKMATYEVDGEPFVLWRKAWERLRVASQLIGLASSKHHSRQDRSTLDSLVVFSEPGDPVRGCYLRLHSNRTWCKLLPISHTSFHPPDNDNPEVIKALAPDVTLKTTISPLGELRGAQDPRRGPLLARCAAQALINHDISGAWHPAVTIQTRMYFSHEDGSRQKFYLVPSNLLAALWHQAALELAGMTTMKRCVSCGQWIEQSTSRRSGLRSDAQYCSGNCRVKACRARKVQQKKRTSSRRLAKRQSA